MNFPVSNSNNGLFSRAAGGRAQHADGRPRLTPTAAPGDGPRQRRHEWRRRHARQTFTITVIPVNDASSFTKGPDQVVPEDSGARTVANWATAFSPGPPNESVQSLLAYHIVSNSNPSLFSAGPAVTEQPGGQLFATDGSAGHLLRVDRTTGLGVIVGSMNVGATPSLALDPTTGAVFVGTGAGTPRLYKVDPNTAATTLVGNTSLGFSAIGGMDFAASGVLYASVNIVGDGGTGGDHLAIIDKATGAATVIGAYGTCSGSSCTTEGIEGIAFDGAGQLWATHTAHSNLGAPGLYQIDPTTGAATFVTSYHLGGIEGPAPSGGIVSLHFARDGTLFGGTAKAQNGSTDGGYLVRIDKTTGVFSYVGTTPAVASGTSLAALAYTENGTLTFTPAE